MKKSVLSEYKKYQHFESARDNCNFMFSHHPEEENVTRTLGKHTASYNP